VLRSEQASALPVFAKKNESFWFADGHAGAVSSLQTRFFVNANLVATGSWLSYFVP
jgi:hypothetical protein